MDIPYVFAERLCCSESFKLCQCSCSALEGYIICSSFGALTEFISNIWITSLIKLHNDESYQFNFDLFRPFVIGHAVKPDRDIVHINIISMFYMPNCFLIERKVKILLMKNIIFVSMLGKIIT